MQVSKSFSPVLGIMSGTSLDGVDLALCVFSEKENRIQYSFLQTETVPLPDDWLKLLSDPFRLSAEELAAAHIRFGTFLGETAKTFLQKHRTRAAIIASHGHTLFHNPKQGYTFQLGHGAALAHAAGMDCVCDFRTGDISLGGQGAPLVPLGDELLFGEYDACLNLGGFSNISMRMPGMGRTGFDISVCNFILNRLARQLGNPFDEDGKTARSGKMIVPLFEQLNQLEFYRQTAPKSLGSEWVSEHILPLLENREHNPADLLHTLTEHIALKISEVIKGNFLNRVLSTGGGSRNRYLIERINALSGIQIEVPDQKTIDFKEALIFALLGYLRMQERINILSGVTGSRLNSCAGAVYKAFPAIGY